MLSAHQYAIQGIDWEPVLAEMQMDESAAQSQAAKSHPAQTQKYRSGLLGNGILPTTRDLFVSS